MLFINIWLAVVLWHTSGSCPCKIYWVFICISDDKLLWQWFFDVWIKIVFQKVLWLSSWSCGPLSIVCGISDNWHFCHLVCLFVLLCPIIPCNVWRNWHACRRCLLFEHLISSSFEGSHFCIAHFFFWFCLCPQDFMVFGYGISEIVLYG